MWPMGAAWLCRHLGDHAEFSVDADFLERRAWPAVRDAARFLLDFLIEDDDGLCPEGPVGAGGLALEEELGEGL